MVNSLNDHTPTNKVNYIRPPGLGEPYMKAPFYANDRQSDMTLRTNSPPPNEDTGEGYFLPDFIANEIDTKASTGQ